MLIALTLVSNAADRGARHAGTTGPHQ